MGGEEVWIVWLGGGWVDSVGWVVWIVWMGGENGVDVWCG